MTPALEFREISKEYRGLFRRLPVRALDGFSLRVIPGEILGFLGPNGAGKTTAMHLAMGFMRPDSGAGSMLGQPFGHTATRRRVGFVAENVALYHRPAKRLIRFYGALNGMRDPRLAQAVKDVMQTLDLEEVAERNAGKFSRGMLQRVALAQALVNEPELLILDEPTSALDPLGRVAVRELLLHARAAGKTIVISSHLLSEIELVCDRVAIVHRGRLVRLGQTSELLESRERWEIVARGIAPLAFSGALARDGVVRFTVPGCDKRAAIERVWQLGGDVVHVNPEKRSLEEIFLELTQDQPVVNGRPAAPVRKA